MRACRLDASIRLFGLSCEARILEAPTSWMTSIFGSADDPNPAIERIA